MSEFTLVANSTEEEGFHFDADIWELEDLGIPPNRMHSVYRLTFVKISQPWLKDLTKRYVHLVSHQKALSTLRSTVTVAGVFSEFLSQCHPHLLPVQLDRTHITDFIHWLKKHRKSLRAIGSIHTLMVYNHRHHWYPLKEAGSLFFQEDFPKRGNPLPRFIPESVMRQFNDNIDGLKPHIRRLMLILQECGMRISEAITLEFHCLMEDQDGDFFLKTYQSKLNQEHTIPVSAETVAVVREQQQDVERLFQRQTQLLFPNPTGHLTDKDWLALPEQPLCYSTIMVSLKKLAEERNITGPDGNIWQFQTHQFRHTVATRMINRHVPQPIVQRFLGHVSPEMTARYAHILDETLKKEFAQFKGKLVSIDGSECPPSQIITELARGSEEADLDVRWLKRNVAAQTLPNGLCALPVIQNNCPHANACLSCANYRTDIRYLEQHKAQLKKTEKLLETARANGWVRQIEINEKVHQSLTRIIAKLEALNDGS